MKARLFACAALMLALAACGGSGGDESPTPAPAPVPAPVPTIPAPSGVYDGTSSSSMYPKIQFLALENGSIWGLYGREVNGSFLIAGTVNANGAANNGSYTATDGRDYFGTGEVNTGTVTASYTAAGGFSGSVIFPAGVVSFSTTKASSVPFNYDTPAQISTVSGSWSGTDLAGIATTVVVAANGVVTGNSGGCAFSGAVTPRASGKNVFDVAVTFAKSADCELPGGSASGIGLGYRIGGTTRTQLIVAIQDPTRSFGTAFVAIR